MTRRICGIFCIRGRAFIKLRGKPNGSERKARYHTGASKLAAFRPNTFQSRAKGYAGQPQLSSLGYQGKFAVGAKICQHKGPGNVRLQQGGQPRAHVAAHKGRGQGRDIERWKIRQRKCFIAAVRQPVRRCAQALHIAIKKNIGHGSVGSQTQPHYPPRARLRQRIHDVQQLPPGKPGQHSAPFWRARHGKARHDIRPGSSLRIERAALSHCPALHIKRPPAEGCGAKINSQRQIIRRRYAVAGQMPCRLRSRRQNKILRRQLKIKRGSAPRRSHFWVGHLTAAGQTPASLQ